MRLDALTTEPDEPGHLPECRRVTVGVSNARAAHMGEGRYVCADGCSVKRAADEAWAEARRTMEAKDDGQ